MCMLGEGGAEGMKNRLTSDSEALALEAKRLTDVSPTGEFFWIFFVGYSIQSSSHTSAVPLHLSILDLTI